MRPPPKTERSIEGKSALFHAKGLRNVLALLLAVGLVLSACGGDSSDGPTDNDGTDAHEEESTGGSGEMETVATLTVDGEPYTFVGVKGGSVLSDDFYCFVGTSGGLNATLALEGDVESELRFTFLPDEENPSGLDGSVTAVIPDDFEHALRDGGRTRDIEIHDFTVTDDSFTISASIAIAESVSGDEHEGTLEASC